MAINVIDKLKHASGGAVVDAEDIEMPDGTRLSAFNPVYPVLPGTAVLEPETFYEFGAVDVLAVELARKGDGKAHEYWFRFTPQEGFSGLTITPAVQWANVPQFPVGKTCVVGICMGMAVMAVV